MALGMLSSKQIISSEKRFVFFLQTRQVEEEKEKEKEKEAYFRHRLRVVGGTGRSETEPVRK